MTVNDSLTSLEAPEINPQLHDDPPLGQINETWEAVCTFRHSGWSHGRNLVYRSLWRTCQSDSRICNFSTCGSGAYVLQSIDDPKRFRIAGSCCHDRFCLPCAQERSSMIAQHVINKLGDGACRFLTLTLKSQQESLAFLLGKLTRCFTCLRRSKVWASAVTGGVAFIEVKWSETNHRWHPHLHCLVQGNFIKQQDLSACWYRVTGDSNIVDIRLVRSDVAATRYVTKYAGKPFNNSFLNRPAKLDEAVLALKGKRLCITFGDWRGTLLLQPVLESEWTNLGKLVDFLDDAARGDADAERVLHHVMGESWKTYVDACPRAGPPVLPRTNDRVQMYIWGLLR